VDREVVLGIRPEDVHDARYGSDPDAVTMPGLVVDVQEVGSHTQVTLEVAAPAVRAPGTDTPASTGAGPDGEQARLTSRFARNAHVRAGQSVPISVDVSRACVFDPVTGRGLWYPER
jgi:multiple sugar transport system ATP-binding protein